MDPVTAVGFAASIATLLVIVVDVSKTLYSIQAKVKNAPEDLRRFAGQFQTSEKLLKEIEARLVGSLNIPLSLRQIWQSVATQIEGDVKKLREVTSKLLRQLDESKIMRLRINAFFKEEVIEKYHRQVSTHHEMLKLVILLVTE